MPSHSVFCLRHESTFSTHARHLAASVLQPRAT
jgi:hypothetical protein